MATLIKLYEGQPGITDTTLYTAGTNTRVRILAATGTNDTTTACYISFHIVPSGGAVGDAYLAVNQKVIGSRDSYTFPELVGHVLEPGDVLSAIAETASQISVHVSGVLMT